MSLFSEKKRLLDLAIDKKFEIVIGESTELFLSEFISIFTIEKIENELKLLIGYLVDIQDVYKTESDYLDKELQELNKKESDYTVKEKIYQQNQKYLNSRRSYLDYKRQGTINDLNQLDQAINRQNKQIEQEKKNRIIFGILTFGIYVIKSNQDIEAFEQRRNTLRREQQNLYQELNEIEQKISQNCQNLQKYVKILIETKEIIQKISKKIKKCGFATINSKNILKDLKIITNSFTAFKEKLFIIKQLVKIEEYDSNYLSNFILEVKLNQKNYLDAK